MSKSLAVVNGDLVIAAGRSFGTVSGREKLLQDLRLWVMEKMGLDPSTPTYGNILDGSITDGIEREGFIGQLMSQDNLNEIRNVIIDLLQRYQTMQFEKIRNETLQYLGENTLEEGEVLERIDSVEVKAIGTTALVQVKITTLDEQSFKLTIPISNGALGNA